MMKKGRKLRQEFLKTMIQLSTSGFGIAAALAWNSTIQALIKRFLPENGSDIWSQVVYAIIITAIAVIVTYTLGEMLQKQTEEDEKTEKK